MRRLLDYFRLCRRHVRLGAAALIMVILARLALWSLPFRFLRTWSAQRVMGQAGVDRHDNMRRTRIAAAIRIASRLVPHATCLTQALAAQTLLRLRGDWARLCLGVFRDEYGAFKAHAWLEADGQVIIGDSPELARYQQFTFSALPR